MTTCPVCDRDVEAQNPAETDYGGSEFAPAQTEYEGETYRFCSEDCKQRFESDPAQYA
ncbi:YHS domain-containing protein [Halostella sp. JP-L12]|uniref:YHS domain-containing protein n=1 Tax=Halostella TaxID=1843185 RepID=UPI000EF781C9|nr:MULTISPECIES: YHS domain-containing protein [Halostella]NHN49771.1 YHS domain-containing protein [Halostella sp. JP-L12]